MMPPEQVIECAIGLFDKQVPPGKYPPVLATDIIEALHAEGYRLVTCDCGEKGRHARLHDETCPTFLRWLARS